MRPPPQPPPPPVECALPRPFGGRPRTRWDERDLGRLAAGQDGVVARRQLLALGLGEDAIDARLAQGRLHPLHAGVYAVGHALVGQRGRWRAAVLAAGPGAVLSHRSAAAALDLLRPRGRVEVLVAQPRCPRPRGLVVHRTRSLVADDVGEAAGLPVTAPMRTLVDLAAVVGRDELERAVETAERIGVLDVWGVDRVVERLSRPRGIRLLRAILEEHRVPRITRSRLERAFLAICRRGGLPRPTVNGHVDLGGGRLVEVDFHWPAARLVAETDGFATHGTRAAMRRDRGRDRELLRAGWTVLRFVWSDVVHRPDAVLSDVECALRRACGGDPRTRRCG